MGWRQLIRVVGRTFWTVGVKTLVEEFGMSPDARDNVSILTVDEPKP